MRFLTCSLRRSLAAKILLLCPGIRSIELLAGVMAFMTHRLLLLNIMFAIKALQRD